MRPVIVVVWMKAYDANYQVVDQQSVPEGVLSRDPRGFTMGFSNVTSPEGNIKYVIAGSVSSVIGLDRTRYSVVPVPEPSTLLLCGVGVVDLLRSRRRSRR